MTSTDTGEVEIVPGSVVILNDDMSAQVLGEVRNVGTSMVGVARIRLAGVDADGGLINVSQATAIGHPCTDSISRYLPTCIPPGEVGWFSSSMQVPLDQEVDQLLSSVSASETDGEAAPQVLVVEGDPVVSQEQQGGISLSGIVRNIGTTDVVNVMVHAAFRDSSGALLDVTSASIAGASIGGSSNGIRAGETADFSIWLHENGDSYASHELRFSWSERGGSFEYGVAGVAHTGGYDGSVWRTYLSMVNSSGADGRCTVVYYGAGEPIEAEVELVDSEMLSWDDVLVNLLGAPGESVGYLRFSSDVPLTITTRTWNETTTGGYGQSMPTLEFSSLLWRGDPTVLAPLRGGEAYRSNIGLVNFGERNCVVKLRRFDVQGNQIMHRPELVIGPKSLLRLNDVLPDSVTEGYAIIEQPVGRCSLWAWASVIDRSTGDPTTVPPDQQISTSYAVGTVPGW